MSSSNGLPRKIKDRSCARSFGVNNDDNQSNPRTLVMVDVGHDDDDDDDD